MKHNVKLGQPWIETLEGRQLRSASGCNEPAAGPVASPTVASSVAPSAVSTLEYSIPDYLVYSGSEVLATTGLTVGSAVVTATIRFGSSVPPGAESFAPVYTADPSTIGSGDVQLLSPSGGVYAGELISDVTLDGGDPVATFRFAPGAADALIEAGTYRFAIADSAIQTTDGEDFPAGPFAMARADEPSTGTAAATVVGVDREDSSLSVTVFYDPAADGWRHDGEVGAAVVPEVDPSTLGDDDLVLTLADGRQIDGKLATAGSPGSETGGETGGVMDGVTGGGYRVTYTFDGVSADEPLEKAQLSVNDGAVSTLGLHQQTIGEIIGATLDASAFGIGGGEIPVDPVPAHGSAAEISTAVIGSAALKHGRVKFRLQVTNDGNVRIKGPTTFSVEAVDAQTGEVTGDTLTLTRRLNLASGASKTFSYSRRLSADSANTVTASGKLVIHTDASAAADSAAAGSVTDDLFCDVSVFG